MESGWAVCYNGPQVDEVPDALLCPGGAGGSAELVVGEGLSVGQLLRRYRRAVGLTQEKLAARTGVSARTISDLERGIARRSRRDTLTLLAEALGLASEERRRFEAAARGSGEPVPPGPAQVEEAARRPVVGLPTSLTPHYATIVGFRR